MWHATEKGRYGELRMDAPDESERRQTGLLDGLSLFRFAHMVRERSGGGVEAYLWDLNRTLLHRNRMQIVQMYLASDEDQPEIRVERIGLGELIWVPSILNGVSAEKLNLVGRIKAKFGGGSRLSVNHECVIATLGKVRPHLAAFHWISEDSTALLRCVKGRGVPFVVVNHFENRRLRYRLAREHVADAVAVGGVSPIDIPDDLISNFVHLSDGIDTDFFAPDDAFSCQSSAVEPAIFFPSRICKEKGHLDAVRALGILRRSGMKAVLVLAGRRGTQEFITHLHRAIVRDGLQHCVQFVGELSPHELREWYARADVVILPSYSEGLGRVLLEGQSMAKPVLAYNVGGVRAALRDGVTGLMVESGDVEGFVGSLRQLLEDPERRRAMGERGREFVSTRFSLASLALRHEAFYSRALSRGN